MNSGKMPCFIVIDPVKIAFLGFPYLLTHAYRNDNPLFTVFHAYLIVLPTGAGFLNHPQYHSSKYIWYSEHLL